MSSDDAEPTTAPTEPDRPPEREAEREAATTVTPSRPPTRLLRVCSILVIVAGAILVSV